MQWEGVGGLYKGVSSPLAGQMFFRATLFSAFGASKRWLATNPDGTTRPLTDIDFFKAGFITGLAAAFIEGGWQDVGWVAGRVAPWPWGGVQLGRRQEQDRVLWLTLWASACACLAWLPLCWRL